MSVGHGPRRAKLRTCATTIGVTACPSAPVSRSRPSAGTWGSTCVAVRTISTAWTSARSSATCSGTAGARSISSGIAGVPIAVARFKPSSLAIPGCARTTSPRMPLNSTRPSSFGLTPTARWRTVPPTTLLIFGIGSTVPCDGFGGLSRFSCHASTPRTCHGHTGENIPFIRQGSIISQSGWHRKCRHSTSVGRTMSSPEGATPTMIYLHV